MSNATRRSLLASLGGVVLVLTGTAALAQNSQTATTLTQADAGAGLREALRLASQTVTARLGRVDGFWGDARVRIPLPNSLASVQRSLRPIGLSGPLDDLELRVNRGAERAMPAARRLLENAVRSITLQDALGILRGPNDAATQYLRSRTENELIASLRPSMESSLEGAGAFTSLNNALQRNGLAGSAQNLRSQLIDFAVSRALDAAFSLIADEERAIRSDPVRRTTSLLRRVFGR
ncbi:MAG: DUF4197 domain-containing protein [Caulobacterales bacterium]